MKKIIKVLLISLFTLFVGYNMLSAEEVRFKDGWSISYNPGWKGKVWTETQVKDHYDTFVIECNEVYNNSSIWPEDVTFDWIYEGIGDEFISNISNKTFSYARQYSCAFLEHESGNGLAVYFVEYGTSYKYFFWFYN